MRISPATLQGTTTSSRSVASAVWSCVPELLSTNVPVGEPERRNRPSATVPVFVLNVRWLTASPVTTSLIDGIYPLDEVETAFRRAQNEPVLKLILAIDESTSRSRLPGGTASP